MNEDKLDLATCTDLDELTRECRRLSTLTGVRISAQSDPVNLARDLAGVLRSMEVQQAQHRRHAANVQARDNEALRVEFNRLKAALS